MLLRLLNRPRRTLVAPTWRLGLRLWLRLASGLGIASRRAPTIALSIHGRRVGAARAATTALVSTASAAAATAAPSLGEQVLGDFRLGEVVFFGCDRGQPGGSSGHSDLRIPDRAELVRPLSGG